MHEDPELAVKVASITDSALMPAVTAAEDGETAEHTMTIDVVDDQVVLSFDTPVGIVGLSPFKARETANELRRFANVAERAGKQERRSVPRPTKTRRR